MKKVLYTLLSLSSLSTFAQNCPKNPIYFWSFNNLQDTVTVRPDVAMLPNASIQYTGTGLGYMDEVIDGSSKNLIYGIADGNGLRARNPSNTRELVIKTPSTGYENLRFSFVMKRSTFGANFHQVYYATNSTQSNWTALSSATALDTSYVLYTFDITDATAADNANLAFKFVYSGVNASGTTGNTRLDNVSLTGVPKIQMSCNVLLVPHAPNTTYQWINCDNGQALAGGNSYFYSASQNGNYGVIVNSNGCVDTTSCMSVSTVALQEQGPELLIALYPNPSQGTVTLNIPSALIGEELKITNALGQVVHQERVQDTKQTLNLSHLSSGLYYGHINQSQPISISIIK